MFIHSWAGRDMRISFHWLFQDKTYLSILESVLDGDFAVGEYYGREGQFSGPPHEPGSGFWRALVGLFSGSDVIMCKWAHCKMWSARQGTVTTCMTHFSEKQGHLSKPDQDRADNTDFHQGVCEITPEITVVHSTLNLNICKLFQGCLLSGHFLAGPRVSPLDSKLQLEFWWGFVLFIILLVIPILFHLEEMISRESNAVSFTQLGRITVQMPLLNDGRVGSCNLWEVDLWSCTTWLEQSTHFTDFPN